MKKYLSFLLPIGLITVLLLSSCVSTPPADDADIWALLSRGDSQVPRFFQGDYDVNITDSEGKTPLHYAVARRDIQLTRLFVSLGANPNVSDLSGQTPLGISIENNDAVISAHLVSGGANIHQELTDGQTPALKALETGIVIFSSLLTPASIATVDNKNRTVLHHASMAGNVQAVQNILRLLPGSAAQINAQDNESNNALDYALLQPQSRSHIEVSEQLILSGAFSESPVFNFLGPAVRSGNYNIRRNDGLAPIHFAVMNRYTGFISFLLGKNIDINIKSTSGATALHEAARSGNIEIIRMLLNAGADVNAKDASNNSPLHTGIPPEVHSEVVTLLLEKEADPNLRDDHGDTPLHIAIILNRDISVIQALLNGGSDIHIRNIQGKTPLYVAVQEHRLSLIPVLLSYGSEIFAADNTGTTPFDLAARANNNSFNLMIVPETVNQRDSEGNTMLHAAIRNRANPTQIALILDQRALVDARNRDGETALHIAVRMNQRESGEFLISRGANIFSLNSSGHSPLYIALTSTTLREWMINPTTINARDGIGNNMLHYASEWRLNNVIPVIIRHGISVEEPNATGETPLFMAIRTNSPSTIRTLLENNANINRRDSQGNSVLHTAVRWNALESTELLLAQRIDINSHSLNGNTALHDAIIFGMTNIESLLIREGSNLEARNIDGNTPLMEAVRSGFTASAERLIQNRADVNTRNIRGDTPLHIAVSMENIPLVNILLRMGVSIHARNTRNRTPFQLSLTISPEMVSTLLSGDRINVSDDMGNSPLHIALQERASENMITSIIGRGLRINVVDSNGRTPLRLAVDMELWPQAKIIADAGADPFLAAVDNKTPAEISFSKGDDCIRALFSGRAINARDSSGNTILHLAARHSSPDIVHTLLDLGANRTIRNVSLEVPFDIAVRWNRMDIAELLRL
jgi:hypothetical protein